MIDGESDDFALIQTPTSGPYSLCFSRVLDLDHFLQTFRSELACRLRS